jgi:positive regulator of sigma E activity
MSVAVFVATTTGWIGYVAVFVILLGMLLIQLSVLLTNRYRRYRRNRTSPHTRNHGEK